LFLSITDFLYDCLLEWTATDRDAANRSPESDPQPTTQPPNSQSRNPGGTNDSNPAQNESVDLAFQKSLGSFSKTPGRDSDASPAASQARDVISPDAVNKPKPRPISETDIIIPKQSDGKRNRGKKSCCLCS